MNELERWNDTYTPAERTGNFRPGVECLPDGYHDLTITDAELTRTKNSGDLILRLGLRSSQGYTVERAYFFNTQQNVDQLGADLVLLGFDADKWKAAHGRKFSDELPKAVKAMPGISFRAQKKTTTKGDKTYHNLFIQHKLTGSAAPPPPPAWNGGLPPPPAGRDENQIPF